MSLYDGLGEILDHWLGLDEDGHGAVGNRHASARSLDVLCNRWSTIPENAEDLICQLYAQIVANWTAAGAPHAEGQRINWHLRQRSQFADHSPNPETKLERTIIGIMRNDQNWANQMPTASGVANTGPCHIDLIHRVGTEYTLFELKVGANNFLVAALQILRYGLACVFSGCEAQRLGYDLNAQQYEILSANQLHLRVLAPGSYYQADACVNLLRRFQQSVNAGLNGFGHRHTPLDFGFDAFPATFQWDHERHMEEATRKEVLWALSQRGPAVN